MPLCWEEFAFLSSLGWKFSAVVSFCSMTQESIVTEDDEIFLGCALLVLTTQICLCFLYASVCISRDVNIYVETICGIF